MNKLSGKIVSIKNNEHISVVEVDVNGDIFKAIIIETPTSVSFLKIGAPINILFKETEVIIAKNFSGLISIQNKVDCKISGIQSGKFLSKVELSFKEAKINSIISSEAVERLNLRINEMVFALIKTNEIMIAP
jgi:molybdopterin-binding protein